VLPAATPRGELLFFGGFGVAPLSHRRTTNPRGPREGVLGALPSDVGRVSDVGLDVSAETGQRFAHFVQMLSESGRLRLFAHGLKPGSRRYRSKNLEVDGKPGA